MPILTKALERLRIFEPKEVRGDLLRGTSDDLRRRQTIVVASMAGLASMAAVSLLQTGIVRHLPDPPVEEFDSDKVNLSRTAYAFGAPDGPFGVASFALNLPLAAFGAGDRAGRAPIVPILAAAKAAVDAVAAGAYFVQMPTKQKAWCGFCIAGALANAVVLGLTIPEARRALRALRARNGSS